MRWRYCFIATITSSEPFGDCLIKSPVLVIHRLSYFQSVLVEAMETIYEAPDITAFVPLIEHQSATPASFYSGPPVLHYHSQRCKVIVLESDLNKSIPLHRLAQGGEKLHTNGSGNGNSSNGDETGLLPPNEDSSAQRVVGNIDVWVTSE
jgi:chloride channel, nucleotide-sensitive, 1A